MEKKSGRWKAVVGDEAHGQTDSLTSCLSLGLRQAAATFVWVIALVVLGIFCRVGTSLPFFSLVLTTACRGVFRHLALAMAFYTLSMVV